MLTRVGWDDETIAWMEKQYGHAINEIVSDLRVVSAQGEGHSLVTLPMSHYQDAHMEWVKRRVTYRLGNAVPPGLTVKVKTKGLPPGQAAFYFGPPRRSPAA